MVLETEDVKNCVQLHKYTIWKPVSIRTLICTKSKLIQINDINDIIYLLERNGSPLGVQIQNHRRRHKRLKKIVRMMKEEPTSNCKLSHNNGKVLLEMFVISEELILCMS